MTIPYYGEYPYQVTTWRHYLGVAIPQQNNPDLLYTWFSFDEDQQEKNEYWPLAEWSYSPTLKYNSFDSSIKNFSYNPIAEILTTSIDYYNQWEEYNWARKEVVNWDNYIITKVYFNNDLVLDYDQYAAQGHTGWPIFPGESKSFDTAPYQIDLNSEDLEIIIYLSAEQVPYHEAEYYKINNNRKSYHYVNFNDNLEQKIILPIGKTLDKTRYETFTFTKLFPNNFESPQEIDELLEIKYYDPINNLDPQLIAKPETMITFNNGYYDKYQINTTWTKVDQNDYILSVEDQFYYNEHQEIVYQGTSNKYANETGVIIPWDYENNYGEINIKLELQTYDQQFFELKLPIKNKYKLSGNQNAQYYFTYKVINDENLDFDYTFNFNLGRYINYVEKQI